MTDIDANLYSGKKNLYEKPLFEETRGLTFTREILESFNGNSRFCIQCSGCHGCR
jgi:hypothetical protein